MVVSKIDRESVLRTERKFLYPIVHPDILKFSTMVESNHWDVNVNDFSSCHKSFQSLMSYEKTVVTNALLAATILEDFLGSVLDDCLDKFKTNEITRFIKKCIEQEAVHFEAYNKLLFMYVGKEKILEYENKSLPKWVSNIKESMATHFKKCTSLAEISLSIICMEGILFHETFVIPYLLKVENKLPVFIFLNEEISRDEFIHQMFWTFIYNMVNGVISEKRELEIIDFFFKIAKTIATKISTSNFILSDDVNVDSNTILKENGLINHLMFLKSNIQRDIGIKNVISNGKPLTFMSKSSVLTKASFFNSEVSDYISSVNVSSLERLNIY